MSGTPMAGTKQCEGKRAYRTKADAKQAAKFAKATFGGRPVHAYRCGHCDQFHVGHRPSFVPENQSEPSTEEINA